MTSRNFSLTTSLDALKALIDKLMAEEKIIGFDLETGYYGANRKKGSLDIDWDQQFVSGFSITNHETWARYVPVAHEVGDNLPEEQTWELMKPVLETLPSLAHNAKFEIRNLRALERKSRGPRIDLNVLSDTAVESYVLAQYQRHGLKSLVKEVFGYDQPELKNLFPGAKQKDLDALRFSVLDTRDPKVVEYACEDAVWPLKLHEQFWPLLQAQRPLMLDIELRILRVVADMEDAGHAVDWDAIQHALVVGVPFEEEMKASAKDLLSQMAGEDLSGMNLASTPQMRDVLYTKIGLTTTRRTDKGELSTDAQALEALSREHPAVKKVLEVREVHNLTNRLNKWLTEYAGAYDERVHPSFNQVAAHNITGGDGSQAPPSGRFSANDPAIQQLPKEWRWTIYPKVDPWNPEHWEQVLDRTTFGKHHWQGNFRNFLVAAPGCYLLGFDYGQIELRVLAGLSKEPSLLEAFNQDRDVHTLTSALMLGIPVEQVTEKTRAKGKTINFALIYGLSEQSLAERLAISYIEAEQLYQQYFNAFTLVTGWIADQKDKGRNQGYVETAFGRKVTIWEFGLRGQQSKAERLCVNAPCQGTAADIMKIAMLRTAKALTERGWWMSHVRMVNNIHDALVFEVSNEINPAELRALLQEAVVWDVVAPDGTTFPKIKADWEIGQLWGSSRRWKDEPVEFVNGAWQLVTEDAPVEMRHCEGCGEDYNAFEESHAGHEQQKPPEPVREEEPPDVLIVEMTDMPDDAEFTAFLELLRGHPGPAVVTLRTPEGEVDLAKYGTCLTPENQGEISMLLGGARVYRPIEQIDVGAFTEGIEL